MSAAAAPMRRTAPVVAAPSVWPGCDVAQLGSLLSGWTLVEFWAPDNLFCRLMAPVRVRVAAQQTGVRLLCCTVSGAAECAAYGVTALPALVLFRGPLRVRRWIGALDAALLLHELRAAMADAVP